MLLHRHLWQRRRRRRSANRRQGVRSRPTLSGQSRRRCQAPRQRALGTVVALSSRMRKKLTTERLALAAGADAAHRRRAPPCRRRRPASTSRKVDLAALWIEPADLGSRNFFDGPGGQALGPARIGALRAACRRYQGLQRRLRRSRSSGRQVERQGRQGSAARSGRVARAVGPRLPSAAASTCCTTGTLDGAAWIRRACAWRASAATAKTPKWSPTGRGTRTRSSAASRSRACVVANMMLNNWDWKTSNNKIYDLRERAERADARLRRARPRRLARQDLVPEFLQMDADARHGPGIAQRRRRLRGAGFHQGARRPAGAVPLQRHPPEDRGHRSRSTTSCGRRG